MSTSSFEDDYIEGSGVRPLGSIKRVPFTVVAREPVWIDGVLKDSVFNRASNISLREVLPNIGVHIWSAEDDQDAMLCSSFQEEFHESRRSCSVRSFILVYSKTVEDNVRRRRRSRRQNQSSIRDGGGAVMN